MIDTQLNNYQRDGFLKKPDAHEFVTNGKPELFAERAAFQNHNNLLNSTSTKESLN